MLRKRPGRGLHDFPSKLFCLTVPKLSLREPFCAAFQKISGSEEFNGYEGDGRVSRFAVESFFLTVS